MRGKFKKISVPKDLVLTCITTSKTIPKNIIQTFKNNDLIPELGNNVNTIKNLNPDYKYYFFW
jgi:mannosyltransferase OCH1-like enzyme